VAGGRRVDRRSRGAREIRSSTQHFFLVKKEITTCVSFFFCLFMSYEIKTISTMVFSQLVLLSTVHSIYIQYAVY